MLRRKADKEFEKWFSRPRIKALFVKGKYYGGERDELTLSMLRDGRCGLEPVEGQNIRGAGW